MKGKKFCVIVAFLMLGLCFKAYGLTAVTFTEGESAFIDLSSKDLNLIKFPSPGIRVYTSSKVLDIKIDERNVFVKFSEGAPSVAQEVFFVLSSGEVFSMILVPREIPAQTIVVRIPKESMSEALSWETSHSYIAGLKELIKAMYEEKPPRGFVVKEAVLDKSRWKEVRAVLKKIYQGATLQGEVYELTNVSRETQRFLEKEFYEKGILAVSIEKHELRPQEKTALYIVKKTKAQREFEKVLQKTNPLDVLKEDK